MEQIGVPTVTIVTERFINLAKEIAYGKGLGDLKFVVVSHPIAARSIEEIEEITLDNIKEVVNQLTK